MMQCVVTGTALSLILHLARSIVFPIFIIFQIPHCSVYFLLHPFQFIVH